MRASLTNSALLSALLCCAVGAWPSVGESDRRPSRILALFPHPGRSHQMVFEPLFRRLAERGNHVTVMSFFPIDNPPPTYRDISLVGLTDIFIAKLDMDTFDLDWWGLERYFGDYMGMQLIKGLSTGVCQKLVSWPTVQELIKSNDTYDVILVENFNSDCVLGLAHRYNAPLVALLSHTLMAWSADRLGIPDNPAYVPAMSTPNTASMSLLQRVENALYLYFYKNWYKYEVQQVEQEILDKHFGRRVVDIAEVARNYSMMLVNTHHSLNGVRPTVPGLIEVGGMHLDRPKQHISPELEKFLNESTHGVIVFSFGSLLKGKTMSKSKIDSFQKVFNRLPQKIIWKWEDDLEINYSDKILKIKWLPQYELLLHPKVVAFIAHGGLLGMTEAADAGKPMLVIPFFGDQPTNAFAAEEAGLATVLLYKNINEHTLYSALMKVLSPEMRESARRLSRVWHDRPAPPLDTAVYWVERTARLGHQQKMASQARNMPAYQVALIDVAAVLAAGLLVVFLAFYCVIRSVFRVVTKLSSKKVKVN